jgi:hypothetical protein
MRDADGARLATIELLEIAARDLDSKRAGAAVGGPALTTSRKIRADRTTTAAVRRAGAAE